MQLSGKNSSSPVSLADIFVFGSLELLGVCAIVGNFALIFVLIHFNYLSKASFILMFSLSIADTLHGVVTTCYLYPPIVLKHNHMPNVAFRLFNVIDWTAWSITITHMSAICIDRLIAIMLYNRYTTIVTTLRVRIFSISCWVFFASLNTLFFTLNLCCLIVPQSAADYYSFDYDLTIDAFNIYPHIYIPIEVLTLCILAISNPITLVQLYRRHQRKVALRRASNMLVEMSIKMGSQFAQNNHRQAAVRKASRQQQRILLQITVVAVIFFLYMFVYYLFFYFLIVVDKWAVVFNSFFYSTTHMINPCVYFGLNKEMRNQLKVLVGWMKCLPDACIDNGGDSCGGTRSHEASTMLLHQGPKRSTAATTTISETSPLIPCASRSSHRLLAVTRQHSTTNTSSITIDLDHCHTNGLSSAAEENNNPNYAFGNTTTRSKLVGNNTDYKAVDSIDKPKKKSVTIQLPRRAISLQERHHEEHLLSDQQQSSIAAHRTMSNQPTNEIVPLKIVPIFENNKYIRRNGQRMRSVDDQISSYSIDRLMMKTRSISDNFTKLYTTIDQDHDCHQMINDDDDTEYLITYQLDDDSLDDDEIIYL